MRFLATFLLNPIWHFLLVCCIAAALFLGKRYELAKYLGGYAAFWFFTISISPVPQILAQKQETHYDLFELDDLAAGYNQDVHVLVLGAGHTNAPGYHIHDRLVEPALKRLLEGHRIQQAIPGAKLICSGYSSSGRQSQAEALAEMALTLGVSPADTLLQSYAYNTEAEARDYYTRFGTHARLILVTSAMHMPRAMFWFQSYGVDPIPAPTNHLVMPDAGYEPFPLKPNIKKIEITQKLLHEYAGMLYAKWKTRNKDESIDTE